MEDLQTVYFRAPRDLVARLDAIVTRKDAAAKAKHKGPERVSVGRPGVLEEAVREYVEREEAKES